MNRRKTVIKNIKIDPPMNPVPVKPRYTETKS